MCRKTQTTYASPQVTVHNNGDTLPSPQVTDYDSVYKMPPFGSVLGASAQEKLSPSNSLDKKLSQLS